MEAIEFLKERARMCESSFNGAIWQGCTKCKAYGGVGECLIFDDRRNPEDMSKAIEIVEQWAKEHPRKTMIQDFFEKFPNAPKDLDDDGTPHCCPYQCGYTQEDGCCFKNDCLTCWSRPVKE